MSSLSERSGRSCCSLGRFSSEKMNMAEIGLLGFSGLAYESQRKGMSEIIELQLFKSELNTL